MAVVDQLRRFDLILAVTVDEDGYPGPSYLAHLLPLNPEGKKEFEIELARSTDEEKQNQINRLREFQQSNADRSAQAIERVRNAAINNQNIFAELVNAVRHCSLGEITNALFEVGGQYRRNM